jgi:hypothetical protein
MNTRRSPVAMVMPCLNESKSLRNTCQSLGFGLGQITDSQGEVLVIVDNGSSDDSLTIAKEVAQNSPIGTVLLAVEEDRGHVPARAKGVAIAQEHVGAEFIVQVDADTEYEPGYTKSLWAAGRAHGQGTLVEATMAWPLDFLERNARLVKVIAEQDEVSSNTCGVDVVVDDKGCGYWLQDYELWGGHVREYWSSGEEMLAETTRLFIRGLVQGARRALVDGATARHSTRNWTRNAELEFASAGFPMPPSWQEQWTRSGGENLMANLDFHHDRPPAEVRMRRKVLVALFEELPRFIGESINPNVAQKAQADGSSRLEPGTDFSLHPARLIESAMRVAGVLLPRVSS